MSEFFKIRKIHPKFEYKTKRKTNTKIRLKEEIMKLTK